MGCPLFKPKFKALQNSSIKRKILLVGLDGAGKTTTLYRLKLNELIETVTTIGLNVETIKHKNLELLVFDVGGQARTLWSYYFEDLDALIFVIDTTDYERIKIVREELLKCTEALKNRNYVLLLYLNKQDHEKKLDITEVIELAGINEIEGVDVIVQKCSALKGEGLVEGLEKLVDYFLLEEKTMQSRKTSEKK